MHGAEHVGNDEHILLNLKDDDGSHLVSLRGVRHPAIDNKVLAYVVANPQVDFRRVVRGFDASELINESSMETRPVGVEGSRRPRSRLVRGAPPRVAAAHNTAE